ncbi:cobalamin-binding protein [Ureibacillus acetophenoni]|uniref:Iron complex transport system substrate-binding protein n=1 Tax=Ureibacillus acetophenoni TaxID=614649 RepID=A0A285UMZ9_9BACL|nr:cobalamin-binding protein [Ureibacillus acetophenoni]SOC43087.1 iron complex transport system substrate-binding protein [Ureibacillus acetophenoni]
MKLISICPSNTELVAYLGLTSSLIGVDDFSDWPGDVQALPRLGPDLNIDMDKVEKLKPDLVLASLSVPGMERNIEELEKRNIPYTIVPNPKTLKEVGESLLFVGKVTNSEEKAKRLYEKYNLILENYHQFSKQIENPKTIYWEWWAKPIFTPGATNWLTELSELCGGINIFRDKEQVSVQTDWEEVKKRNPDVMCIVWVGVQKERVNPKVILKRPQSETMNAIKHNELYILEESLFCRPSPRLLLGLNKLANILHPTIFSPLSKSYVFLPEEG